ncbi:MAG: glutamate racemase [Marinifilaceae bacterium]|jgi:glutamate racemase|nr:glutamate racemase [Marinifilaceae bacterium]
MKATKKIGIFDSGYGGLTILSSLIKELPDYDYIYLGDNARTPYGTRSFETIYKYSLQATKKLFEMDCQIIIFACNTASAKALRSIQQNDLPKIDSTYRVLGVIRPSVEEIENLTQTNHVGILGTTGTVKSMSYPIEIKKLYPHIKVSQQACPMWVPLVENREYNTEGGKFFIQKSIEKLLSEDKKIDTIILGCTHYPIIEDIIKQYIPENIKLISQGSIIAESFKDYLRRHPEFESLCSKNSSVQFYTTESNKGFEENAGVFLNKKIYANTLVLG